MRFRSITSILSQRLRKLMTFSNSSLPSSSTPTKPLLLPCAPSSISFPTHSHPIISDPTTLDSLTRASSLLHSSHLVSFPTETVYGLGANALSTTAVSKIFKAKGRPSDNPLIVHVSDEEMVNQVLGSDWKSREGEKVGRVREKLMKAFWPGPMTLLFPLPSPPSLSPLSPLCTASLPTVGLRMPSNPIARALISLSNLPLAAPSANKSGRPSTTSAQHVLEDYTESQNDEGLVKAVLDGGECEVGIESSVIELVEVEEGEGVEIRILRAGGLEAERIVECLKDEENIKVLTYGIDFKSKSLESKPPTPGMKYKHYSPQNSQVILIRPTTSPSAPTISSILSSILTPSPHPYLISFLLLSPTLLQPPPSTPSLTFHPPYILGPRDSPNLIAQRIFSGLRELDSLERHDESGRRGADVIFVEEVEERGVGVGVMERLRKSAGGGQVWEVRFDG